MANETGNTSKKRNIVQHLPAFLALVGTVAAATVPILLNNYSNQIFIKPDVDLAVISNVDNDGRKALIKLTNDGSSAATNLSLTIETPKKISSITNEFSTTDITIPRFNKTSLDMHVPKTINQSSLKLNIAKFAAGRGSLIKLETLMDAKQNLFYYNYTVAAAYDQGSTMGKVLKSGDALTLINFPSKVAEYIVENPILVASELAIIPVGWIVFWWLVNRYKIFRPNSIIQIMLDIRKVLKHDIYSQEYPFSWDFLDSLGSSIIGNQNYFDISDLFDIQDLAAKMKDRNEYLKKNSIYPIFPRSIKIHGIKIKIRGNKDIPSINTKMIDREQLKKYNEHCLDLVEDALMNIDWTKYIK